MKLITVADLQSVPSDKPRDILPALARLDYEGDDMSLEEFAERKEAIYGQLGAESTVSESGVLTLAHPGGEHELPAQLQLRKPTLGDVLTAGQGVELPGLLAAATGLSVEAARGLSIVDTLGVLTFAVPLGLWPTMRETGDATFLLRLLRPSRASRAASES